MGRFQPTGTLLDQILENTQRELDERKRQNAFSDIVDQASRVPPPRDWMAIFERDTVALVAECKRASPSKGVLIDPYDPVYLARAYEANGAAAISVLTDTRYFEGSLDHLTAVHAAVRVPVLRKDFIIDPLQIYEGRAAGADAILLIAAVLDDEQLAELYHLASMLGMAALIEVHHENELESALKVEPKLIGINNRDLKTFLVDLSVTERLVDLIPNSVHVIAESGIHGPADVRRMGQAGAGAVLVGESLVTAKDIAEQVRLLANQPRRAAP